MKIRKIFFYFLKETICSLYQKALNYTYEFDFEKRAIKDILYIYYKSRLLQSGISQTDIDKVFNLLLEIFTLDDVENTYLKPPAFLKLCNSFHVSPTVFNDEYYSFIFSDYSNILSVWRQSKSLSQKKAAKILKLSPVDLGLFEKKLKFPQRRQYIKIKEIIYA